ncbi:MAG: hypothetical protein AAGF47_01400 [Planctomycetota bacterium]
MTTASVSLPQSALIGVLGWLSRSVFAWAFVLLAPAAASQLDEAQRSFIGRQLTRAALIDYRLQADPGTDDAALAAEFLAMASGLRPDDPHVLRFLIQARRQAGDDAGVIDATRTLLTLDPDDDVALLRLIAWQISQRETVESRLDGYAFWLDGRGAAELADRPAVLSRLALDAALLEREIGNERGFVQRLDHAARLDETNKEAALLVATYFADRSDDPIGRLELAINVLLADPLDPNLHLAISDQLVQLEAFEQAARFHRNGTLLAASLGAREQSALVAETTAFDWYVVGPEGLLEAFEASLASRREAAELAIQRRLELGEATDDLPSPEDIRLSIDRERYRLFAAVALDDRVAAERAIRDLQATVEPAIDRIADEITLLRPEQERTRLAYVSRAIELAADVIIARLLADVDVRLAGSALRELQSRFQNELGDQVGPIAAMLVLRQGTPEEAERAFEPWQDRSALGAIGSAIAARERGDTSRAIELFEVAARRVPLTPAGAFGRYMAEQLSGGPLPRPAASEEASAIAAGVPAWVDTAAARPREITRLSARLADRAIDAFDEAEVIIEIRNLLPRALGMGDDRPVRSRFAFTPSIAVAAHPLPGDNTPEVVDLHRRLRLEPGEAIRLSVWPTPGVSGWVQEVKGGHRQTARWNAIQGFVAGQGVPFAAGPLSRSSETDLLSRRPSSAVRDDSQDLIRNADVATVSRLIDLLPVYRAAMLDRDRPGGTLNDGDTEAIARSLAARLGELDAESRIAIAVTMPSAVIRRAMQPLDDALFAETDPGVLKAVLLTRVTTADHPVLGRAMQSTDPSLVKVAELLAARLARAEAGAGRGVAFLAPPPSHLPDEPEESAVRR